MSDEEMIAAYVAALSDKERVAYTVAQRLLGSSLDMSKCNGFLQFKKDQKKKAETATS
jgi:hypothetical protein